MNALEFADTNIVVYAVGHPSERQAKARAILAEGLTVSSQVINETVSVLSRKQGVSLAVCRKPVGTMPSRPRERANHP
ncbi:PIN domain-containing protein [Methylovulum psychrotolerans]|uniref:PIN domain-containing protein n=1 Tax=Methylovulum psychrotolerans TaxID=1704499 RepID=UPI002044E5D5|nr:PIN domain-containing protein [Methylovulum psychrotolerans]